MGVCNDFSLDEKGLHNMKTSIVKPVYGHIEIVYIIGLISSPNSQPNKTKG